MSRSEKIPMSLPIYRLLFRNQFGLSRLLILAGLVGVSILIAFGARAADDPANFAANYIAIYGINIFVPICALALGTAALGDLVEDKTLVYVWLRPIPRSHIATAALAAVITAAIPAVVVPLTATALITNVDGLPAATAVASALAVFAYSGLFIALGLRFNRSLLWGLAFIAVWEGLLSRVSDTFSRLSVRSYPTSIIADSVGVDVARSNQPTVASYVVPIAIGLAAMAYTAWRLTRTEID